MVCACTYICLRLRVPCVLVDLKSQTLRAVNIHPPLSIYSVYGGEGSREGPVLSYGGPYYLHAVPQAAAITALCVSLPQTLFARSISLPTHLILSCPEMLSNCEKILFWLL